ncbi:hypothetical protein Lser_V15G08132 [Lactuca serriola]
MFTISPKRTMQMQVQNFGEPFLLIIHENETLASVKIRIQRKLEVHDDEFSMQKFALVFMGRPEYLQDSDAVSTRFQIYMVSGNSTLVWNTRPHKRPYFIANQNGHTFEKPVKIYNYKRNAKQLINKTIFVCWMGRSVRKTVDVT